MVLRNLLLSVAMTCTSGIAGINLSKPSAKYVNPNNFEPTTYEYSLETTFPYWQGDANSNYYGQYVYSMYQSSFRDLTDTDGVFAPRTDDFIDRFSYFKGTYNGYECTNDLFSYTQDLTHLPNLALQVTEDYDFNLTQQSSFTWVHFQPYYRLESLMSQMANSNDFWINSVIYIGFDIYYTTDIMSNSAVALNIDSASVYSGLPLYYIYPFEVEGQSTHYVGCVKQPDDSTSLKRFDGLYSNDNYTNSGFYNSITHYYTYNGVVNDSTLGTMYHYHFQFPLIPEFDNYGNLVNGSTGFYKWDTNLSFDLAINGGASNIFPRKVETFICAGIPDYALSDYWTAYNTGYDAGSQVGSQESYQNGYNAGYRDGSVSGTTWLGLFGAVADTPIIMLRGLFNFDLFGMNLLAVVCSLIVGIIVFGIVKRIFL